jgi:hypothetical protein
VDTQPPKVDAGTSRGEAAWRVALMALKCRYEKKV